MNARSSKRHGCGVHIYQQVKYNTLLEAYKPPPPISERTGYFNTCPPPLQLLEWIEVCLFTYVVPISMFSFVHVIFVQLIR